MFSRKQALKRCFIFPSHLTSASALHFTTGNLEMHISSHKCCMLPCQQTHITYSDYHLRVVIDKTPTICKMIDSVHQTWHLPRLTCCRLLHQEMSCSSQAWSEGHYTVLLGNLTMSVADDNFVFYKTARWCNECQNSPTAAMCNSPLSLSWATTHPTTTDCHWLQDGGRHTAASAWTASQQHWKNKAATGLRLAKQ